MHLINLGRKEMGVEEDSNRGRKDLKDQASCSLILGVSYDELVV